MDSNEIKTGGLARTNAVVLWLTPLVAQTLRKEEGTVREETAAWLHHGIRFDRLTAHRLKPMHEYTTEGVSHDDTTKRKLKKIFDDAAGITDVIAIIFLDIFHSAKKKSIQHHGNAVV